MPKKHLFRFSFRNQKKTPPIINLKDTAYLMALDEELKSADDILAKSFPLYVIPVDLNLDLVNASYDEYTRDEMQQLGDIIYIWLESRKLRMAIRQAGYKKRVVRSEQMSEGGRFVAGNRFCLLSDVFPKEVIFDVSQNEKKPVYSVHSFTSVLYNHIDCDYGIVDDAEILYASRLLWDTPISISEASSRNTLDTIASETGYQIRMYPNGEHRNGINFITGSGKIFTTGISPEERAYLRGRGIEVVEIPLRRTASGAGLRCAYGEAVF